MIAGCCIDLSMFFGTYRSPTRLMPKRLSKLTFSTSTRSLLGKVLSQVAASAAASLRLASPAEDAQLVSASTPQATSVAPSNGRTRCQRDRLVAIS